MTLSDCMYYPRNRDKIHKKPKEISYDVFLLQTSLYCAFGVFIDSSLVKLFVENPIIEKAITETKNIVQKMILVYGEDSWKYEFTGKSHGVDVANLMITKNHIERYPENFDGEFCIAAVRANIRSIQYIPKEFAEENPVLMGKLRRLAIYRDLRSAHWMEPTDLQSAITLDKLLTHPQLPRDRSGRPDFHALLKITPKYICIIPAGMKALQKKQKSGRSSRFPKI